MKRLIGIVAVLAVMVACEKKIVEIEEEWRVSPVDTDFIDGQPTVYAVCSDSSFSWAPGDSISVLESDGSSFAFKTFVTSGSGKRAMFIGPVLEKGWQMTGASLYPANPGHSYNGTAFKYVITGVYDETLGAMPVPLLSSAMVAERTLGFNPVGGLFALELSSLDPGARYTVRIETSGCLCGTYTLSADGMLDKSIYSDGGNNQTVAVLADAEGKATAFFPLATGNHGSLSAAVFASNGKKSWSGDFSGISITAGGVVNKTVTVPAILTPQQAIGSLSDWASVANVYSASNTHGGIPDYYNAVSGEPSPTLEVKFRSDADFLYGYVKVDTTRFIYRYIVDEEEKVMTGPASSLNNFTVWADNDDVTEGQSVYVGHFWHYTGYNLMIRGASCDSCKPKDWKPSLRDATVGDITYGKEAFGTAVSPAPTDVGFGNDTLTDGIVEFQFVVSRDALGIAGKTSAHIGIAFDEGWAGWSSYTLIPDKNGFDVELSNE